MEPLTLKPRQAVEDAVENWDDDDDLQGLEDLHNRNFSSTTLGSVPHHRDSVSSRMSTRSDRESTGAGDEDWQVLLPTDDEKSTADAIKSATSAGIPIPQNVPSSALLGGTIKRLGGRKIKKVLGDDWGDDLEIPKAQDGGLKLKKGDDSDFDSSMRQFSAEFPSSPQRSKTQTNGSFMERLSSATKSSALDRLKEDEGDDFGDVPTIKLAKTRSAQKPINFIPPPPHPTTRMTQATENFEDDFEIPDDGKPLRLSTTKETPKTPASQMDDTLDMEWAEGSLGTRFGGTKRDVRSIPSSSVSAFSPSSSSRLTGGESEDEGFDDLILLLGPFKFEDALRKRLESVSPEAAEQTAPKPVETPPVINDNTQKDDFFSGIDIGDGEVFDSGKLTLNRNIKTKAVRQTSPKRTAAMTLTFTNKIEPSASKIPRPQSHDRIRTNLEPVSESGGPIPFYRRSGPRMMGHSSQSSISSIPTPATPTSQTAAPSTPSRRGLNTSISRDALKPTASPSSALLKSKRSMPAIGRGQPPPTRTQPGYQRPPSRGGEFGSRPANPSRPKTPVDRSGAESSLANSRKPPVPFLPAGMSHAQSHHISTKHTRQFGRPGSSDSNDNAPINRPLSRLSHPHRPVTPTGPARTNHAPEALVREAASKRTLTKPTRRRAFGDGNELEIFDDLPTSASSESKFTKQPVARGAPKSVQMRSKLGMQTSNSSTTSLRTTYNDTSSTPLESHPTPSQTPTIPPSPMKHSNVPSFARDTAATRYAREQKLQRMGSVSGTLQPTASLPSVRESGGPLSTLSANFIHNKPGPHSSSKHLPSPMPHRLKKKGNFPPQKPRLIKPLNEAAVNSGKSHKGMFWNPTLFCWEGNENALAPFDIPAPSLQPSLMSLNSPVSPNAGKAPALITNVGASKGVQVNGGMVFDPSQMRWLKVGRGGMARSDSNPISPDTAEDDEDPFAGFDDLEDGPIKSSKGMEARHDSFGASVTSDGARKNVMDEDEEQLVGEEFDVGPDFVRRQRVEEERWRSKVAGWVGEGLVRDEGEAWKWAIRDKAVEFRGLL